MGQVPQKKGDRFILFGFASELDPILWNEGDRFILFGFASELDPILWSGTQTGSHPLFDRVVVQLAMHRVLR